MRKIAVSAVVLLLSGFLSAFGQQHGNNGNAGQDPSKFWLTPGQTDHDSKGNVTYSEIKDPKTFTTRVFSHGQWATYHYRPNSTDVVSIDTPDSTDDLLYDSNGKWNGVSIRIGGKAHLLRYDRDKGTVATNGLPAVSVEKDVTSGMTRDLLVRRGLDVVASAAYGPRGEVESLTVGTMTITFSLAGDTVKETLRANGTILKETATGGGGKRFFHVLLDPVAPQLGIGKDWMSQVQSKTSVTGYMTSILQGQAVVARLVDLGGMRVAFDSNASPLFYDLGFDYGASFAGKDPQENFKTAAAYQGALPTHIIVMPDGNVGAYVEHPGDGAIRAFWTTTGRNGQTNYMYSVYNASAPKHTAGLSIKPTAAHDSNASLPERSRVVAPLLMTMCDSSTVCTYSDGCPSCGSCETTYYWCDSGGGGGYNPPPGDSGGAGGGPGGGQPTPGNHIYDATTRQAADRGINAANDKLTNTQCSETLLKDVKMPDGTSMWSMLEQKGMTAGQWFGNIGWYFGDGVKDFNNQTPCNAASAWTSPSSTKVYVCSSFKSLRSPSIQGDTMIHEMLHTLGLPECNSLANRPCPAGYMTVWDIEQAVEDHCGS
jgi:hypothetical protein